MSENKTGRNMGLRLDPATDARLVKMESETGLEGVNVARRALIAVLDFYEAHGYVSFPLQLIPKQALAALNTPPENITHLNEDAPAETQQGTGTDGLSAGRRYASTILKKRK